MMKEPADERSRIARARRGAGVIHFHDHPSVRATCIVCGAPGVECVPLQDASMTCSCRHDAYACEHCFPLAPNVQMIASARAHFAVLRRIEDLERRQRRGAL